MVNVTIYSKNGNERAVVKSLEYDGTFMGDRYVSVTVESPTVIDWKIGDYLEYRGERWSLWLLPATSKVARVGTYGGAIEYKDLRFCPTEEELRRCSFLDVVLHDNEIHYTSLPNFSFYCATAKDLADRIQANLNRLYPGQWTVTANPAVSITDQSLTFSNNSCWDALVMANTSLGLNFIIDSANREIVIGGEGAFIETVMEYGMGNGLKSVERTIDDNQQVVNRLYAYGNTRNLPYRYYNKRYAEGTSVFDMVQSMYLPNLMLPGICKEWDASDAVNYLDENGNTRHHYGSEGQEIVYDETTHWYKNLDGTTYEGTVYWRYHHYSLSDDGQKYYCDRVWIESEDSINKCGVQEGVKFFDGSDDLVDDIYPSITGFSSTEELAAAMGTTEAALQNLSYEQGELYEILGADVDSWDGIIPEQEETTPTFYIRIKNIGFDLSDAELDASGDTPRLSMKSGMCTGREFNILECKKQVYANGEWSDYDAENPVSGAWSYYLKCEVAADESIGQYFPNDSFTLAAGDTFVILGIRMPDVYVDVAEMRLLKAAIIWLSQNDKTAYNYSPAINNIYMAENPETSALLKEGNVLHIYDADLEIDVEMTISQIKIKNDKKIPEYEVTLSNDKEADLIQRVTAQVQQTYTQFIGGGNGGGSGIYLIGTNSNAAPTDNNAFSARRSLRMFLRKDVNDTAAGKITFNGGTDTKTTADYTDSRGFLSGWLGYGARIGTDQLGRSGVAEFEEVNIRGALRAAELIFNKISAEEGEAIRSIGHGEIETVDEENFTATLKLEGDEWATIDVDDICRGLYNTVNKLYDNATNEGEDDNGFRKKAGFFASYFKIEEVLTNAKGECSFRYSLQPGTTEHPCPLMKFAVYGNFNRNNEARKKARQSCMYITAVGIAPRLLFLAGVNEWQIRPWHIKAALGNLNDLQVYEQTSSGAELKTLYGDAGLYVEDNIYLGGAIEQFIHANLDDILAELGQGIHAQLLRGSDNIVVDALGNIVGGIYETFTDGTSVVKRYKLHTGILVYDSGKERYLGQDEFTISYVTDGCDVLRDGNDFYITNIHNTNDGLSETVLTDEELTLMRNTEQCGINFVITTNSGWRTQVSYPIKITHLDTAYINFQLNNEFDSISYRSQLSQYDGVPVTTAIEAYVNGERLEDLVSITVDSDLFDAPVTINTESEEPSTTIEHECGLDFTVSLDGSLTITRHSQNGTETDLEDAKHQFYISAVAKYAGINYESGIKTFTLQEITDSTLYKLLLSATAISKDSGIFTPSTIDVKVQVNDNNGVNVYTASAFNQRGTTRVRYINGVYSQSAVLLETMPSLTDQTTCITVLIVDLANPSSPVILDTQSITINAVGRDGAGQPYVKTNVDSFSIDCDANGVPLTSVPDLIVDAELYWGDGKCALTFNQCYIKYKGVACTLDEDQLSESVSASISINASEVLTSSNIEIYLIGNRDGIHSAVKTIPVNAIRQGATGGTGRGVVSIVTYYEKSTEFEGIVPPSENVNPTTAGWSDTRIDPTQSEPYLWRFTRITYTSSPSPEQTDAELIYVWQDIVNPNLLEDTEFLSSNDMGAWHDVGQLWSNGSGDANTVKDENFTPIFRPVNTYNQGYNQFYSRYKATDNYGDNSGKGYINIMSQYVNRPSTGIAKIEAGKWYTLSFYMYGSKGNSSYDSNPFQLACSVVHVADVSEGVYVNGTRTSSGYCNFVFEDNSFVRKTITFKTKSDLSEDMYVCWQMYVREYTQEIWICKPKLEAGQTATDYRPMRNVDEPIARTSTWEAGKQYYQGRKGEPFVDIVSRYGTWYRCQVTHVSKGGNSDNGPVEGSSSTNWDRSNKFGFVATDLLLADQAVIKLMFSQKILMTDSQNRLTASINADEHGSYCIYYPSGNRRMMFSYDGFIRYYNDDDGSVAWTLGHGGDITKGSSDDWAVFPLHKLVGTESSDFTEDSKFNLTNYWQFHSGSGGNYSPYDGNIYTSKPNDRNPATATLISDGFYTPNYMPFQDISGVDTSAPAITVYTISNGAITSTRILIANTNS